MEPIKVAELRARAHPPGLTPKEAAAALGGSKWGWTSKLLRRLARENRIEAVLFGSRWYISQSAVNQLKAIQEAAQKLWERPRIE